MTSIKIAAATLGLAALLAGCGSTSDSGSAARAGAEPTPVPAREPTTIKGSAGEALTLLGSGLNPDPKDHSRSKVKVTLKGTRGPIKGFDIRSNRKLIGVLLRVSNVGEQRYEDPLPDGKLKLVGGGKGKQTSLIPIGGTNPCKNPTVNLKKGQAKNLCIAFQVPTKSKLESFEYVTDSGYGDTGRWAL